MLLVIKRTGDIQMNDLNDTAKHHHLQYSVEQLKTMCSSYYRRYAPKELTHRQNSTIVKLMTMPFLFF